MLYKSEAFIVFPVVNTVTEYRAPSNGKNYGLMVYFNKPTVQALILKTFLKILSILTFP